MPDHPHTALTQMVQAAGQGHRATIADVTPSVYLELRAIAAAIMRNERPGQTLQPTALVNQAYVRLFGSSPMTFNDRRHVVRTFALVMKRVLLDRARRARPAADGTARTPIDALGGDLDLIAIPVCREFELEQIDALYQTLERLRSEKPDCADVVELRYFVGLTEPQTAEALGISESTVRRYWRFARAWLHSELDR